MRCSMRRSRAPGHRRSRLAPAPGPSPPRPDPHRVDRTLDHTVAPSTTSAALTSITTGLPPGEHGVVGYRVAVDNDVMNVLSWRTKHGDARERIVPEEFQPHPAFCGQRPVVVQNARLRPPASPGPIRPVAVSTDGGPCRRCRSRSGERSLQANRSSTPTTTASTRSPTSSASASTTTPSWLPSTGWCRPVTDSAAWHRPSGHSRSRTGGLPRR